MSLQEIKNEVCIKNNFAGWSEFIYTCQDVSIKNKIIDEVMKIYAMECLKRASENAKTIKSGNSGSWYDASVNKESITNENNIIK